MSDALITVNNLSLNHNGKNILDDVSFKLHPGEFITLIGPNGAGKSSLIKVLLGLSNKIAEKLFVMIIFELVIALSRLQLTPIFLSLF